MVVAHKHQARSMGDMLAALNQQQQVNNNSSGDKKRERRATASQFVLAELAGRYNKIASADEDFAADEPIELARHEIEEELRRVPLLPEKQFQSPEAAPKSRWKSCKWLSASNNDADEEDNIENVRRAQSKKSLIGSLFSHSSERASNRENEQFLVYKLKEEKEEEKAEAGVLSLSSMGATTTKRARCSSSERPMRPTTETTPDYKRSLKLLSLLSPDSSLDLCARAADDHHHVREKQQLRANNRESATTSGASLMTSYKFPASIEDCCHSPIAQQHYDSNHWQQRRQQQQLEQRQQQQQQQQREQEQRRRAAARKLASSSPLLSSASANGNHGATGDFYGSSNKEQRGDATAARNRKLARLESRRRSQQQIAAATRNGEVALMKQPRVERTTRCPRQLEAAPVATIAERAAIPLADNSQPLQPIELREDLHDGLASRVLSSSQASPCKLPTEQRRERQPAHHHHHQVELFPSDAASVADLHWQPSSCTADLECHENHAEDTADEPRPKLAALRSAESKTRIDSAKNNAATMSSSGFGLALAEFNGRESMEASAGDGQREADNHPGRADANQLLLSSQRRRLQHQQQQQQQPARRTVTNGTAPLACQLDKDDEDNCEASLGCLDVATNSQHWPEAPDDEICGGDDEQVNDHQSRVRVGQQDEQQAGCYEESRERQMSDRSPRFQWQQRQQMNEAHDLNNQSVTTRLVGTCANSWRQAALMASPVLGNLGGGSHSGSYRVAQQQQQQQPFSGSSNHSSQTNQQQQQQQQQQRQQDNNQTVGNQYGTSGGQEVRVEHACQSNLSRLTQTSDTQEQQQVATSKQQEASDSRLARPTLASQRRLTRPGRSPISLQRQTNARLARHRLKIQQQRQEQLASLALREREQLTRERQQLVQQLNRQGQQTLAPASSQQRTAPLTSANDGLEIEILPEREEARRHQAQAVRSSSFLSNLLERLAGRGSSGETDPTHHQINQQQTSSSGLALVDFSPHQTNRLGQQPSREASRQSRRHQNHHSIAIQICDADDSVESSGGLRSSVTSHRSRLASTNMRQFSPCNSNRRHETGKRGSADSALSSGETMTSSSLSSAASSSSSMNSSTLSLNKPFCKICHLSSTRNGSDKLISPCKCSGTMQYIHCGCLLKWLEISNRTNEKPISCELCSHEYTWHKRFNYQRMKLPKCSSKDILLHLIFIIALGGMLFCALAPLFNRSVKTTLPTMTMTSPMAGVLSDINSVTDQSQGVTKSREISFGSDHHPNQHAAASRAPDRSTSFTSGNTNGRSQSMRPLLGGLSTSSLSPSSTIGGGGGKLANDEKFILICAAFFFISFFIAIYAQTKTRDTLYGLIVKFTNMNLTYYITEYDHGATTTNMATGAVNAPPQQQAPTTTSQMGDRYNNLAADCPQSVEQHNQQSEELNDDRLGSSRGVADHKQGATRGQSYMFNSSGRKASF